MTDNPPAALLLDEVRKALEAGLVPGFAQKVAANALGIALRELESGPAATDDQTARLSAAIKAGAIDDAVIGELIGVTLVKLAIDQPGYPPLRAFLEGRPDRIW